MDDICLPCDDPPLKRDANGFFKCPECSSIFKQKSHVTEHLAFKHDVGVTWYNCDQCSAKFKKKSHLTRHLADKHDVGVTWYNCDQCSAKFKRKGSLIQHLAFKHDVGVTWYNCDKCSEKFKHKSNVTEHLAFKHDVGVTWYNCDQCSEKFKKKGHLTRHLADKHDVGVTWHNCDQCSEKFKRKDALTRHLQTQHYNVYCQRRKQQEERVRLALLLYGWNEWSSGDTLPPPGHFKREHQIDFTCAGASEDRKWCRIDFVLSYDDGTFVFLEVDEHQHRFGYDGEDGAHLSCDSKRMANVQTSVTFEFVAVGADVPTIFWLRYNPQTFHVNGTTMTVKREEREKRLCDFLSHSPSRVGIGYAFYDYDDESGLDVLSANEFHPILREMVENLREIL